MFTRTVHLNNKIAAVMLALAAMLPASCSSGPLTLREKLEKAAAEGKVLYGHQDDLMYGHSWNANEDKDEVPERSDVKEVCGDYPAVLGLDLGEVELGGESNLDGNDWGRMRSAALKHAARGGIVTLSWHMRNPATGGDSWDWGGNAVRSVLPGGDKEELFKTWLKRGADYIESFKDEKGKPVEIIFRPWHEHSGDWFWWGEGLCSAEEYNALWVLTYDYFVKERGLTNLIWAISPNPRGEEFFGWVERYPGDGYVDIIGLDLYAGADNAKYIDAVRRCLDFQSNFAKEHNKLLAFTETGLEGIPQENWWTEVLAKAIEGYPVCYLLTWRNASDRPEHFYAPFRGQASAENFKTWVESERILTIKDIL